MISHDYRKEIGLKPGTPTIPWPIAIAVLALGAAGLGFGFVKLKAMPKDHHATAEVPVASLPKPAAPNAAVRR